MARFHFRLEKVLSLQQRRLRLAELRQQQADRAWRDAEAQVAEQQAALAQLAAEMPGRAAAAFDLAVWQQRSRRAAFVGQQLTRAEQQAQHTAELRQQAVEACRQARIKVEALQTLKDRLTHEHRQKAAAAEQQRLEAIVLRQWAGTHAEEPS